jgi:hypothetical protein
VLCTLFVLELAERLKDVPHQSAGGVIAHWLPDTHKLNPMDLVRLLRQLAGEERKLLLFRVSPQVCAEELEERTPLPLISLLEAIHDEVARRKFGRVAIFGARVTIEAGLFGRLQKVTDVVIPRPE